MANTTIEQAKKLEEQAAADRSLGDEINKKIGLEEANEYYDSALRYLKKAIEALQKELKTPESEANADDKAEMRAKLADYFGSRGGIFRRQNKNKEALAMYEDGIEYENETDGTYNLSNAITWSLRLGTEELSSPKLKEKLSAAISRLEQQVGGERLDDWWAHADLAQFLLFDGRASKALDRYREGTKSSGPSRQYIESSLGVLQGLQNSPIRIDGLETAIEFLQREVNSM